MWILQKIKTSHTQEKYLSIDNYGAVTTILRFRTGSHHLPCTNNRFNPNSPSEDKHCTLCSQNVIGNEQHYMFSCPFFDSKRTKLLKTINMSSLENFNIDSLKFLHDKNKENHMIELASFIRTILNQFTYDKPNDKICTHADRSLSYKPVTETRCGRNVRPPAKLNL